MRGEHIRKILTVALDRGSVTARQLAYDTGLSVVTVNAILHELTARGLLVFAGLQPTSRGRHARAYAAPPAALKVAAVVQHAGELVAASSGPGDPDAILSVAEAGDPPDIDRLAKLIIEVSGGSILQHAVVGLPVRADAHTADIRRHTKMELARRLGCAVSVRSTTELTAIAEAQFGVARGVDNFVQVTGGQTTAVSHVVNGVPHDGAHGLAGLLWLLADRLPGPPVPGPDNPPSNAVSEPLESALAAVCLVADPALVVLGKELTRDTNVHLPDRLRRVFRQVLPVPPEVASSAVGGDPALRGALQAAQSAARKAFVAAAGPVDGVERTSRSRPV